MKPIRFTILFVLISLGCFGQTRKEVEELYKDANSYFYFEDYEEALALYLQVLKHSPDNYNLQYRIGFCYLNIPGQKQEAIPFLEQAASNTTTRYSEVSINEKKAPVDAIFYLGNAYFANNQLSKAEDAYLRFKEHIKKEKRWDMSYFEHQSATLVSSKGIQRFPVNFLRTNVGEPINDRFSNFNPVISADGNTMAFTTKRKFYQAVYIARKRGNKWGTPQNITLDLFVDGNCSTLSLSQDGNELYLFRDDTHDGNIYVSRFNGEKWSPMKMLNKNINTEYYETHASISADGKSLYFTSNRTGGFGDLDIYLSRRDTGDNWGPAVNLGKAINTELNENTPFITADGQLLYFSSEAHNNMGGYDFFVSQRTAEGWSKPINLGYPLNTTDDDLFFSPIKDGSYGLIALFDNTGFGEMDICEVEIFSPRYKKAILTSGELASRTVANEGFKTLIIDTLNTAGLAILNPDRGQNITYLDASNRITLFYQGNSYSMRDQSEAAKLLIAKLQSTSKGTTTSVKATSKGNDSTLLAEKKPEGINREVQSIGTPKLPAPVDELVIDNKNETIVDSKIDSTSKSEQPSTISNNKAAVPNGYSSILLSGVESGKLRKKIESLLFSKKVNTTTEYNTLLSQLIEEAIASKKGEELLMAFARMADLLISNTTFQNLRQKRTIESNSAKDNFLYLLNKVLEKASPELRELIESTLGNNSSIQSFEELIAALKLNDPDRFQKLLPELISILGELTLNEFNLLPTDEQDRLEQIAKESTYNKSLLSQKGVITVLSLILLLIIAITARYLLRKRK